MHATFQAFLPRLAAADVAGMTVSLHTLAVAALVVSIGVILLLQSTRVVGKLVFVGAALGITAGVSATALAGHLI